AGADRPAKSWVQPCAGITLSASYLAEVAPGQGPGFLFRIDNRTSHPIRLAEPVPSSAHWYARVGKRWLWRASAGRGGALVDALRANGPMFAYRPTAPAGNQQYLVVPAHDSSQWSEAMLHNDAIAYRPSCPICNYPGEDEYQAVFAYAWLPGDDANLPDLLHCGLRSAPVPMPPHSSAQAAASH
ncbi:MAG TPA: hypothetical protein VJS11_07195, partial [Acidobacteriaceae bacterium]|nr:hypothetical protein [Acidobacteriaceae bacterium]